MKKITLAVVSFLSLSGLARAQARLADCVRDIKGDSVALYFDERYELTPVACATFCRYTRLDPKGNIYGEVRDYRLATQRLASRQHYDHGVREGSYEAFYPNGQLSVRGAYTRGNPSGEWQWWYAGGQPWQTLRADAHAPQGWRYLAYADSTGQQLLANGTGHWQQTSSRQQLTLGGAVLNELPNGDWQLYSLVANQVVTSETYERGVFKKGRNLAKMANFTYRDRPQLVPVFSDPSDQGVLYKRGLTCQERSRQQTAGTALDQRLRQQRELLAGVHDMQQPKPEGDPLNYLHALLQKLSDAPSMKALLHDPQYTASIEADIDEYGNLNTFQSNTPDVQHVFEQLAPSLGRWQAATVNGQPARSHVKFSLSVLDQHWQISYHSNVSVSKPAAP